MSYFQLHECTNSASVLPLLSKSVSPLVSLPCWESALTNAPGYVQVR